MHKKIRQILYIMSVCLSIAALLWTVYLGIQIHPAFAFTGSVGKKTLLLKSAFPVIASAVCLIALSGEGGRFRLGTLTAVAIASALPTLTIILLYAQHGTASYYQAAAVMFYACPYALTQIATDLIGLRAKTCTPAIVVICALLLPLIIAAVYCSVMTSAIELFIIMYAALPTAVLLLIGSIFAGRRTKIILCVTAAVFPLCGIFIPYAAESVSSISGLILAALYICSTVSAIFDIKFKLFKFKKEN